MSITHALIFAAGYGKRMRPLTDHTPKPLLEVRGKRLIEHHLLRLADVGVTDVVVNTSWLAEQFEPALGDGERYDLRIHYSMEGDAPLETGGGMLHALPTLGEHPFYAINGDAFGDFALDALPVPDVGRAHVLVAPVPAWKDKADFGLAKCRRLNNSVQTGDTPVCFCGVGVYSPLFISQWEAVLDADTVPRNAQGLPAFSTSLLLRAAADRGELTASLHQGEFEDVGTPERLAALNID